MTMNFGKHFSSLPIMVLAPSDEKEMRFLSINGSLSKASFMMLNRFSAVQSPFVSAI